MQNLIARHAMTFGDGRKTVTTAGTAERLVSESTLCYWVEIQTFRNAGYISVGTSTTAVALGTERGIVLGPESSERIEARDGGVIDLYDLWVNVAANGQGVNFFWGT